MFKTLIPALLFTTSVVAQPYEPWGGDVYTPEVWYEDVEEGLAHFGKLVYWNQVTANSTDTYEIETPEGPVVVHLEITKNVECATPCPDTLTVYGLPDGVVAIPQAITAEEGTFHNILLYKYIGG